MKGRPWYKRYPADILHGTMALNVAEKGAYNVALDLMYDRGGPIPDDPRWLARQCGCSMQQWRSLRDALIAHGKLTVTPDGCLSNGRAIEEISKNETESDVLRLSGQKGGLATKSDISAKNTHDIQRDASVTSALAQEWLTASTAAKDCGHATGRCPDIPGLVGSFPDLFKREVGDNSALARKGLVAVPETRLLEEERKKESPPAPPEGGARRPRRRLPQMAIPDGWIPDADDTSYAVEHRQPVTPDAVAAFRDWHKVQGLMTASVKASWKTWCRNAVRYERCTPLPVAALDPTRPRKSNLWR